MRATPLHGFDGHSVRPGQFNAGEGDMTNLLSQNI